jgi:predicted MFS family arabinose efflux permease
VTLTQIGYGLGVLLVVPLGDIVENRRLILTMMMVAVIGLLGITWSTRLAPYFAFALATGLGASTVQIIVPYAAHFTPPERRGQVVGNLMSGLMLGIMMSRPLSGLLSGWFSWHAVFLTSAVIMAAMAAVLSARLPVRPPESQLRYTQLLASLVRLFLEVPLLRRRAIYQACLFAAFCLFWTASPLVLASPAFGLSQTQIAVFALVGVAGAVAAPYAGRAADRNLIGVATAVSMIAAGLSFALGRVVPPGSPGSLAALVVSAVLLDAGITANLVLGQRAIFTLPAEYRSRLNGLYVATIFVGGSCGSALGAWAYARGGWPLTSAIGVLLPASALALFATERLGRRIKAKLPAISPASPE